MTTGRADVFDRTPGLALLAAEQARIMSRSQLAAVGVTPQHVQVHVEQGRWRAVTPVVIALHTGPVVGRAQWWVALLNAGPRAALCAWTALEAWGLSGWEQDDVHVVVPRGADPPKLPNVMVHESRRHRDEHIQRRSGLALHGVERAAIDAGAWSRSPRAACGLLAAVVRQRLTTADRLLLESDQVGRVRHLKLMQYALGDIAGGAHAMSEIDFVRLCRDAGLPEPAQQQRRRDAAGRWRYLDVVWRLWGGRTVTLEIDGVGHMDVERWYDDLLRAAEVTAPGETMLRLPAMAARTEPERVTAILRRYLLER
ncbi:MAG: hypothetical protein ACLGIA_03920 [Actinomycetes bacterium]